MDEVKKTPNGHFVFDHGDSVWKLGKQPNSMREFAEDICVLFATITGARVSLEVQEDRVVREEGSQLGGNL